MQMPKQLVPSSPRTDDDEPIFHKEMPILAANIARMYHKLSASSKMMLSLGIKALKDVLPSDGTLPIGSFLSGSEVQFFCWVYLCEHWAKCHGDELSLTPRLEFAVENEPQRQAWIREYARPSDLFQCVHRVAAAGHGTAATVRGSAVLRDVVHVTFGIECDSISGLSSGWNARLGCVEQDKERTGQSAVSCLRIIFLHKIASWLAECVQNLRTKNQKTDKSPADNIVLLANENGYVVWIKDLQSSDYGDPTVRVRTFLYGQYVGVEVSMKQQNETPEVPDWFAALDGMVADMAIPPASISACLLDSDDAEVIGCNSADPKATELTTAPGKPAKRRKLQIDKKEKKVEAYETEHLQMFNSAGLDWPPTLYEEFEAKTIGLGSSRRMRELVYYDEKTLGSANDLTQLAVRDVNLSAQWGKVCEGEASCIASSTVLWVRGPRTHFVAGEEFQERRSPEIVDRVACGAELMRVNGWSEAFERHGQPSSGRYTNKFKGQMAGNMMTSGVLSALFTAIVATTPLASAIAKVNAPGASGDSGNVVLEDEDVDGEPFGCNGEGDAEEESKVFDKPIDIDIDDLEDEFFGL